MAAVVQPLHVAPSPVRDVGNGARVRSRARGLRCRREQLQRIGLGGVLRQQSGVPQFLGVHALKRRAELPGSNRKRCRQHPGQLRDQPAIAGVPGGSREVQPPAPGRRTATWAALGEGEARDAQDLRVHACARSHGLSRPDAEAPVEPRGLWRGDDQGGVVLAVPSTINVQSPAYQEAATACNFH